MNLHAPRLGRILLAIAMFATISVMVQGHAKLERSEPAADATLTAPPPHVELWFNEAPDVSVSKIEITGPSGKVALGPVHSMEAKTLMAVVTGKMADGKYTVAWQAAGDDGHVNKGEFSFSVRAKKAH